MSSFNNFNGTSLPSECSPFHAHPGIANPTASNNIDNYSRVNPNFESANTKKFGAGSGPEFVGRNIHTQRPGLNELNSGIIETTKIDPLNENSKEDELWANTPSKSGSGAGTSKSATGFVAGVAKLAYGKVAGDEQAVRQGRDAVHGTK